ncbi:MAG TPA: efflux RND transporter periplasmic adaptor subunit [Candidatus Baltobacteraceae bacterium]|nr:efflux RND transporter periplasmic adaptor subunit [Candidatus Baltobacteraceae bacterium]
MSLRESYQQRKKLYLIGAAALVVIIAGWLYARSKANDPKFTTAEVHTGNITASVQATGTINALTTIPVGSYVSGTVEYIFADYNTRVHSGQVLAQLDPAIYEAQVTEARGNLENAQANLVTLAANVQVDEAGLAKVLANVKYEQATAKRSQDLFSSGIVSADSNDLTQSTLGQAQADVASAQATVDQARATLAQARTQVTSMEGALKAAETSLKYTTIISPIDGTVVARNIDVGQSVAATLQAPQVFTVAQDLTRMQVYAAIDESDTGNIKVGTPSTFQVDAFPTDLFHGRVSAVRLNPTTVQNVVTYSTVIDFSNPDEKLLPGETAYVTIPTGHAQNALLIPNPALTFKPSMTSKEIQALYKQYNISREASTSHLGGWQVVWKLGPDKKELIPVQIQAGITDYNNTQLLQGDLHQGDVLVIAEQAKGTSSGNQRPPGFGGGPGPR